MADGTCTVPKCSEPILCRDICIGHYQRLRKTGDVQADKPLRKRAPNNPGARCGVARCPNANTGRGLCGTHRHRLKVHGDVQAHIPIRGADRRGVRTCTYPDCPETVLARDLCGTHYRRWWEHGDPSVNNKRARKPCAADDCPYLARVNGLCDGHYQRLKRTGELRPDVPLTLGGAAWRAPVGTCAKFDCHRRAKVRGFCKKHYSELRMREIYADPVRAAVLREQRRQWHEAWREANPDRMRELNRAWRVNNREAARANDMRKRIMRKSARRIPYTAEQLMARMRYWGLQCWMCGGPFEHVDHVKPLAKGGWDMIGNLRPACQPCNGRKHDKWPVPLRPFLAA